MKRIKKILVCILGIAGSIWCIGSMRARETKKTETQVQESGNVFRESEAPKDIMKIALTFDDGPSQYTSRLSEGLKKKGVSATFFLLGENMEKYPEEGKKLAEDGHLLGNHSYSHVQLNKIPLEKACQEIIKTNNLIFEATGSYPQYVRPPFGEWSSQLEKKVEMFPVFWNLDSLDWKVKNTEKIVKTVTDQTKEGSIILMHDGYETSVEAAFQIVDLLQKNGFEFVTVDQMILD